MSDLSPMNPRVFAEMQAAAQLARVGNLAAARGTAERALEMGGNPFPLHAMLGGICCAAGDMASGIAYLRQAHAAHPQDVSVAVNLANALLQGGMSEDALTVCSQAAANADPTLRLWRLRAYLLQLREDHLAASEAYRLIVTRQPEDPEAWNNLGNSLSEIGRWDEGVAALDQALALSPQAAPIRLNHATALVRAGRLEQARDALLAFTAAFPDDPRPLVELAGVHKQLGSDDKALDALRRAAERNPGDPDLLVQIGTEEVNDWQVEEAERSFRAALAIAPGHAEAFVLLAVLYEHMNREDRFAGLIAEAEAAGVDDGSLAFMRALVCRREKRFAEGLAELAKVADGVEPIRCAQLAGQFHDRLEQANAAFAAFSRMNDLMAEDPSRPKERGEEYRHQVERDRSLVTRAWIDGWTRVSAPRGRRSPTFLLGFPRSGTTLLDTMLMGHPDVRVTEERSMIFTVEQELGGIDRIADLDDGRIDELRERYFAEACKYVDLPDDALLIDKSPLHLNKVPLIHRLFPDAQFILALRHPCDVVLSCFIANFRLNAAMANFLDLKGAADLYDVSFGYWEQARALLPLKVHSIRYEQMVTDAEAVLRPLSAALGLDWRDEVLDHRQTAMNRGIISTASYAQVLEPLYDRAAGRWNRYRPHLEPIMPILQPWVGHFGYAL